MDPFIFLMILFGGFGTVALTGTLAVGLKAKQRWEKLGTSMRGFVIIALGLLFILICVCYGSTLAFFWIWKYVI